MCSGNTSTGGVQEQKTDNAQKTVINTNLNEHETALTRTVPDIPPVEETRNAVEADRFARVKQIQVQPVPELTVPEKTLFDDYVAVYWGENRQEKVVKNEKVEYADRYKEKSISENKRSQKAKNPKSRLYRKAENARQIEDASGTEQEREIRLLKNASKDITVRLKEEDTLMLTKLMSGDAAHDKALLERYAGDKTAKEEVLLQLLEEFMQMDLTGYDLSNDEAIAGNAAGFEALSSKVEAMLLLVDKNPAFFSALPEDVQESFKNQRKNALMVVSYYRLTKMIVTDPYYRTHYNSEISRQWDPTDPPAKQRLTRLLWMRTGVASHPFNGRFWKDKPMKISMEDIDPVKKNRKQYSTTYWEVVSRDGEFAKQGDYDDVSNPHFQFFRQLEENDPVLAEKIKRQMPALAGTDNGMTEALVRGTTRALEGMRGIRHMTQQQLVQMLNDIYAVPQKEASPEEIEQVRQRNLTGLRQYKQLVAEQVAYIDHKYPFLHEYAPTDEVEKHKYEIQDDVCMNQIMESFMDMIRNIPELYDPEDPNDQYISHALSTLSFMRAPQRYAGATFDPRGEGASKTMVGMRMSIPMDMMMFAINRADYGMINMMDKLENDTPDVKWEEEFTYQPLTVGEPVPVSKTLEKMERRSVRESRSKDAARAADTLKDQDFSTGKSTPKTTDLMKHVKSQYFEIDRKLKEPIPEDEALFNSAAEEIEGCYLELIRACSTYEEKRNPWTDLGKQRKEMVHTIRENALREMDIFRAKSREYFESRKGGTFGDVIGDFERAQAIINGQLQ